MDFALLRGLVWCWFCVAFTVCVSVLTTPIFTRCVVVVVVVYLESICVLQAEAPVVAAAAPPASAKKAKPTKEPKKVLLGAPNDRQSAAD